ncbi:hypothetical protein [Escherichia sp. 93.0816]|uniref:hypothetical protein n=1 Tax=Escherichia sp. 93.0816 TaxID=2723308 RepID=UPI001593BAE7|nr:hypothetical protein [Escherichia sp. 93.0816]EFB2826085.1 hypothetical protein [Escherichia coli]MBB2332797.1 hypothetical protein [Escherichia sp. 93.0816]
MATILTPDCDLLDLLSVPFNAATDFTVLADYCARFAETLIETDDPALRLALCGRLHACLALLQLLLERPAEPKTEQTLTGLLCELVWYFTEGLKAPRWLRTADGVKFISEVAA